MPRKDEFILPDELGMLSAADWDAKGKAAVYAWQPMSPRWRNAPMYTSRRPAQAQQLPPLLAAHLETHHGHFPDAVADTTARRRKAAKPMLARLQRLAIRYPEGLKSFTVRLFQLDALNLYSLNLAEQAHESVKAFLKAADLHGSWVIERGRDGGTHAHIVTGNVDAENIPNGFVVTAVRDVQDAGGLASYLAKPADARACKPRLGDIIRHGTDGIRLAKVTAAEQYLESRVGLAPGERLPRLIGHNLPRRW